VANSPGTGLALAWKLDIPAAASSALPNTETLATSFKTLPLPNGNSTTDNSTDVFVDMAFDTTVVVGNTDPTTKYTSVHSLHEVPFSTPGGGACSYNSPIPKQCFQSPNNITFKFTCTAFPGSSLQTVGPPLLSLKQQLNGQAGNPINLQGTNGKGQYRFDATKNQWVFNWNVDGFLGSFNACTFDPSGKVQTFCVPFSIANKCSK
jgi:hypothetical protein